MENTLWYHSKCDTEFMAPPKSTAKCPTCGAILLYTGGELGANKDEKT